MEKPGFSHFWHFLTKWIPLTLPSRSTVSIAALNDIYQSTKNKLVEVLRSMPEHAAITFDGWTDKHKHRHYITFTYHCIDNAWKTHSFVLKTTLFADSAIANNIQNEYLKVISEFGLESKKISLVTDSGSNMLSACRRLDSPSHPCVAHKVHNLITNHFLKDDEMTPINELVTKLSNVQTALLYSHSELEEEFAQNQKEKYLKFLLECVDFGKCVYYILCNRY